MKQQQYDYVIIGAGIAGCCVAYQLAKHNDNILIVDKLSDLASGASGAAGAFLSPLLGKPNAFKDLVTNSLKYSTEFYQKNFPNCINTCGTTRIPQNDEDTEKFQSYIPYMDFDYTNDSEIKDGFFFKIGSVVDSYSLCKSMIECSSKEVQTQFDCEITDLKYEDDIWILKASSKDTIKTQNIILTTGSELSLFDEFYLKIRAVWGCRIDISTQSKFTQNYHKACSISKSKKIDDTYSLVSIGATHHREKKGVENLELNVQELLEKANDIKKLEGTNVLKHYVGARACSVDYFPMVGDIINSKETLEEFPYMVNGTHVETNRFTRYKNAYVLTGVGGRGFVLSPYLAKQLVEKIVNKKELDDNIRVDRLFKREVKRIQ